MIRRSRQSVSVAWTGSMLRGRSDAIESLVSAAIGPLRPLAIESTENGITLVSAVRLLVCQSLGLKEENRQLDFACSLPLEILRFNLGISTINKSVFNTSDDSLILFAQKQRINITFY